MGGTAWLVAKAVKHVIEEKRKKDKKILFVVSSHGELGHTGERTGYYLSEVAHPWKVLTCAGYEIDFVSPRGGMPPVDGFQLLDPVNRKFWNSQKYQKKLIDSLSPEEVNPDEYSAIFYAGGHGAMWDFPPNTVLADIARRIYEAGGVVAAVCHGPAGLLNVKLSDGKHLIEGKKVSGFTNEEEELVKRTAVVPFLLEDELKNRCALYEKGIPMVPYVVVDSRIVTGQNPLSAKRVGKKILEELEALEKSDPNGEQ